MTPPLARVLLPGLLLFSFFPFNAASPSFVSGRHGTRRFPFPRFWGVRAGWAPAVGDDKAVSSTSSPTEKNETLSSAAGTSEQLSTSDPSASISSSADGPSSLPSPPASSSPREEGTGPSAPADPPLPPPPPPPSEQQLPQAPPPPPPQEVDPHTLFLTDDDKAVYELLQGAATTEKLLSSAARIPAVRECPDYHLKITNAGRSDAFLASIAVARLANVSKTEAEMEAVISDRRFGQLIECITCQSSSLSLIDISNTLFGLSILRCREDTLLASLTQTAIQALNTSTPTALSDAIRLAWSCAHASALLTYPVDALLDHIAERVLPQWQQLSPSEVTRLAWSLAVSGHALDPLLRAIGETAATNTTAFGIRDLTHVAWSLSRLGYRNMTVRDAIATSSVGRMAELPVEDLAKLARSLALWGTSNDVLLLELLICAEAKRADLESSHTADVLWALGRANFRNASSFLSRELPDLYQRIDAFNPQDLVKVLWSYATLLDSDTTVAPVLSSLAGRASVILEDVTSELEPIFLSQATWALAKLGLHSQELCVRVAAVLEKRVSELGVAEVTSLAWAFAKLGSPRNPLFDQLAALVESRHTDFTPRELSHCLWGLAVCGYKLHFHSPLALEEEQVKELKPSEVSSLLWAVAKVSSPHPPREVTDVLCNDIMTKLATFSPHDLTEVAWALSTLPHCPTPSTLTKTVTYLSRACHPWLPSFTPSQLATITDALLRLPTTTEHTSIMQAIKAEMDQRLLTLLQPPREGEPGTIMRRGDDNCRALFHLCRCQQMLLTSSSTSSLPAAAVAGGGEHKEAATNNHNHHKKGRRWKYEIGKRALSSFF